MVILDALVVVYLMLAILVMVVPLLCVLQFVEIIKGFIINHVTMEIKLDVLIVLLQMAIIVLEILVVVQFVLRNVEII